jgi:hypothetical protein
MNYSEKYGYTNRYNYYRAGDGPAVYGDNSENWPEPPKSSYRINRVEEDLIDFSLISIDGDTAQICTKDAFGNEYFDDGVVTQLPLPKPDISRLDGQCISVNTFVSENRYGHVKDPDRILDYRAILTAKQVNGYEYFGDLVVHGVYEEIPFTNGPVSFTMMPFNANAYREAGGRLQYMPDAYGIIDTDAGRYFVIADEAGVVLEPAAGDVVFCGAVLPEEQYDEAKRMADDTKLLMFDLLDDCRDIRAGKSGYITINDTPPLYPGWLPVYPGKVKSSYSKHKRDLYDTSSRTYHSSYLADFLYVDDLEKVYDFYVSQLSGCDGFDALYYVTDPDTNYQENHAIIVFSIGAYSVLMQLGYVEYNDVVISII